MQILESHNRASGAENTLRQEIILAFDHMGENFLSNNSSIHPDTITNIRSKRKDITSNFVEAEKKRGPKNTPQHIINEFIDHFVAYSEPADSKKPDGDRHFIMPIDAVCQAFPKLKTSEDENSKYYSLSNMKKHIPNHFKKMHRYTGRCPYCKTHSLLAKRLNILTSNFFHFSHHHPHLYMPSEDEWIPQIQASEGKSLEQTQTHFKKLYKEYKRYDLHLKLRDRLKTYERGRQKDSGFPLDTVAITADKMAPLKLGKGPDATSDLDQNHTYVAVFNVTVTIRKPGKSKPENHYFDIISQQHDSCSYLQNFFIEQVVKMDKFLEIIGDRSKIEFYSDTASGFVSQESLYFVTHIIPNILPQIDESTFCPFCPRHGKSICDRHFQKVKAWCAHFENVRQIVSISEVIAAIHKGKTASNKSRTHRKKPELFCFAFECTAPQPDTPKFQIHLPGIQATHGVSYIRTNEVTTFTVQRIENGKVINTRSMSHREGGESHIPRCGSQDWIRTSDNP